MILIDDNLILRAIERKDAPILYEMINDPEIEKMVVGWSLPVSEQRQIQWIDGIKSNDMRYIIELDGSAIGMASITGLDFKNSVSKLNIKIKDKENKGKGVGTRTIKLLVKYCFEELNLNCLTANILVYNIPSQKLFEKCGFRKDGILRSRVYKMGKYHDIVAYSLIRSEYKI